MGLSVLKKQLSDVGCRIEPDPLSLGQNRSEYATKVWKAFSKVPKSLFQERNVTPKMH